MTVRRTITLAALIYFAWITAWVALTYYVTSGNPATWGRTMFALFGPVIGLPISIASAVSYRDLIIAEKKGRSK